MPKDERKQILANLAEYLGVGEEEVRSQFLDAVRTLDVVRAKEKPPKPPCDRKCRFCGELIEYCQESPTGRSMHHTCYLRTVMGSVAHQQQRCSCFVAGSTEGDPPGMTLREAANAAVDLYDRLHPRELERVVD